MPPEFSALANFAWIARGLAVASKSHQRAAMDWLTAVGAPARVKAAIGGASTFDSDLGAYGITIGDWSNSARTIGAYYRILSDGGFTRVPLQTVVGMIVGTTSGALVDEGSAVPVGRVTLGNVRLEPQKAQALIVVTDELLRDVSGPGQQMFNRELLSAVSMAVDAAFVAQLIDTGSPSIASTSPLADLRAALLAVNAIGIARPYWIAAENVAKLASTVSINAPAFAAASAIGGELANLPLLISSGLADGTLVLIDAAGIAADGLPPTVEVSSQADIRMDSAPDMSSVVPTPAQMTSMFQSNSTALKASAVFGCEKLRDDAISVVTGITDITWGA